MIPVSIVSCRSYQGAAAAVNRALDLLGGTPALAGRGAPLLLKPNLLAPRPPETAVTTHPDVVAALLAAARDLGARPVVADSPGLGSARRAARVSGVLDVCRRFDAPLVDLGRGDPVVVTGPTYRGLHLAREAVEAPWLWNAPKWKTHTMMGLTLGVKNLYGCVPGKRKLAAHLRAGRSPRGFALQLLDLEAVLSPTLTVLDGVLAMEGPGPGRGTPVPLGLILASRHTPALDEVATALSGFDPADVPTVAAARQTGRVDPGRIERRGDPPQPRRLVPAPGSPSDWALPGFLKGWLRGAVSPAPRFTSAACTGCGVCVQHCPAGALGAGQPPSFSPAKCIRCYCCQELCPTGAAAVPKRRRPPRTVGVRPRGNAP